MNNFNHKPIGRYLYGGRIYIGQCTCGKELTVDVDQLKELVNHSYVKPRIHAFTRVLSLF